MAVFPPLRCFASLELCFYDGKTFHRVISSREMLTVLPACHFIYHRLHFSSRSLHRQNANTLSGSGVQYWHLCPLFSRCGSVKMSMRKLGPQLSIASAFESFHHVLSVISSAASLRISCPHSPLSLLGFLPRVKNHTVWMSYELANHF